MNFLLGRPIFGVYVELPGSLQAKIIEMMWNYRGDLCPMTPRNPIESGCIFLDEEKGAFRSKQNHPGWAIHFNFFVFNKIDHLSQIRVEIEKNRSPHPRYIWFPIYQLQSATYSLSNISTAFHHILYVFGFAGLQLILICLISYYACGSPRHHQESWYRRRWPATATRLVNGWCEWVAFL